MENCIFCKIAAGEIPSTKVYEDERVLAFRDIDPQAPVHVLLIPKKHFADILECDSETFAYMQKIVKKLAVELGIAEKGFRVLSTPVKTASRALSICTGIFSAEEACSGLRADLNINHINKVI